MGVINPGGGSGVLPPNIAYTNVENLFTVGQNIHSDANNDPLLIISDTNPTPVGNYLLDIGNGDVGTIFYINDFGDVQSYGHFNIVANASSTPVMNLIDSSGGMFGSQVFNVVTASSTGFSVFDSGSVNINFDPSLNYGLNINNVSGVNSGVYNFVIYDSTFGDRFTVTDRGNVNIVANVVDSSLPALVVTSIDTYESGALVQTWRNAVDQVASISDEGTVSAGGFTGSYAILSGGNGLQTQVIYSYGFPSLDASMTPGGDSGGFYINTQVGASKGLSIRGFTSQTADLFQLQLVGGNVSWKFDKIGRPSTGFNAPSIAAGAGAGTTPTVSIAGSDVNGVISVTTGTLPTLSATIATITYSTAYAAAPKTVILTPANSNAALLSGVTLPFINSAGLTITTFALTAGTTALTASTAYKWYYQVLG